GLAEQLWLRPMQGTDASAVDEPGARRELGWGAGALQVGQIEQAQVASIVESFEPHRYAPDEKLGEQMLQLHQPRPALEIGSNRQVRSAGEGLADQARQHALRPDLDEGARAGRVHGFDLVPEAHGGAKVLGQ